MKIEQQFDGKKNLFYQKINNGEKNGYNSVAL